MFSNYFTTNFSQTAAVKKFRKSVNIWQTYGQNFVAYFFLGYPVYNVSQKNPPWGYLIFSFFHKRLRIFNRFFTHQLYVPIYARLQIFIQLSPTLTKLCHIKRYYLVPSSHNMSKMPKMRVFRRLRKSLIALLIVVCGKSL